jgi:hypothetical protein
MEMKRQGESTWGARVERWKKSGKSQRAFCLDEKCSFWSFRNWKAKLAKGRRDESTARFVELPIREAGKSAPTDLIRITSPCGVVIEIGTGYKEEVIRRVTEIVRGSLSRVSGE